MELELDLWVFRTVAESSLGGAFCNVRVFVSGWQCFVYVAQDVATYRYRMLPANYRTVKKISIYW